MSRFRSVSFFIFFVVYSEFLSGFNAAKNVPLKDIIWTNELVFVLRTFCVETNGVLDEKKSCLVCKVHCSEFSSCLFNFLYKVSKNLGDFVPRSLPCGNVFFLFALFAAEAVSRL